jgi:hypothetical protein
MTVKNKRKDLLDTTTKVPSGEMLYGLENPDDIKKRYKEHELTESMKILLREKKRKETE